MQEYGKHSETERMLVEYDGLANLILLKIQSDPLRKFRDSSGDEMNLWLPQSEQSKAECSTILSATSNFLSSQDSKPLIGLKQDGMTGGYLLTYGIQHIEKDLFMEILTTHYFDLSFIFSKLEHIKKVHKHTQVYGSTEKITYFQRKASEIKIRFKNETEKLEKEIEQLKLQIKRLTLKCCATNSDEPLKLSYPQNENLEFLQEGIRLKNTPTDKKLIKTPKILQKRVEIISTITLKQSYETDIENCKKQIDELENRIEELEDANINQTAEDELLHTGHSLFSVLLPDDFEYYCKNNMSPDGTQIYISRGVLLSGTLNKTALGNASGSMIHHLAKDYGNRLALEFVSYYEMMINNWLIHRGFSIGMADCIPKNTDLIDKEINKCMLEARAVMSTEKDKDLLEVKVTGVLNKAITIGQKIARDALDQTNSLVSMIRSGAKGNDFNVTQITGLVGQQNVGGQRMQKIFGGRTLPHYQRSGFFKDIPDMLPKNYEVSEKVIQEIFESRGFVKNSFYLGLKPGEFFFHAASGREGCIDTACRSITGEFTIIIIENGIPKMTEIGNWIDNLIDVKYKDEITFYKEQNMEIANLPKSSVFIPTTDEDGNMSWEEMTAVVRHDHNDDLYEIKTHGGRRIIVTGSKSLLIYKHDTKKFTETYTSEVSIGDFVPVTMNLQNHTHSINYIDMTTYLPKNEYVYGTDFLKAVKIMKEAMIDAKHGKIQDNWWKDNNGTSFTLPYISKARLQRVIVRSNVYHIKEGCIYPFSGNRQDVLLPERFELNKENGIFIGLYLADGHTCFNSGSVCITKNNVAIQNFLKMWFDKHQISYKLRTKIGDKGTSNTIFGHSSVLISFLDKFVGSYHKRVPDESFIAPEEFIIGLLNGFFSGDGTVGKNSISCCSTSEKLIDGINMLCNRLGIFCKMLYRDNKHLENTAPVYQIDIRSKWARIFAEKIDLVEDVKNERLRKIRTTKEHKNFTSQNDVVLDPIVSIMKIDSSKYSKVYDVTVPKTLNFVVASGLNLRDTSDTGYTQRKLIKVMEDYCMSHNNVVHSVSSGNIIEFSYGNDNMDASKLIKTSDGSIQCVDIEHIASKLNRDVEWQAIC